MKILKFILCFICVPVIPLLGIGIIYGIGYYIFNYYYITVPMIIFGLWTWAAAGLYKEWF